MFPTVFFEKHAILFIQSEFAHPHPMTSGISKIAVEWKEISDPGRDLRRRDEAADVDPER